MLTQQEHYRLSRAKKQGGAEALGRIHADLLRLAGSRRAWASELAETLKRESFASTPAAARNLQDRIIRAEAQAEALGEFAQHVLDLRKAAQ